MSLPVHYPLSLYRGDTVRAAFVLWADAAKTQPVDLTGATAAAEIRGYAPPYAALGCVITSNRIDVTLDATTSRGLPPSGAWDLQLTWSSGDVRPRLR